MRLVLVLLVAVSTACTSSAEPAITTGDAAVTTSAPSPLPSSDTTTTSSHQGQKWTIDEHLVWMLGVLNGADVPSDEYESRFAQVFRDQVSFADFPQIVDQVTAGRTGWTVIDTETRGPTNFVVLIAPTSGEPVLRLLLNMDDVRQIDGLYFQPGELPSLDDPPETYDEAFERLGALGTAAVLVAETTDGSCEPIAQKLADAQLPIGSMFKIYVLGAVAEAVADGQIDWDDPVTLDEHRYSLPSGVTQNEEPGTTLTVQELAQRMIAISDNTATDHLIALVGRDAVEAIQGEMGHADPSSNTPFLTTRELFQLKLGDGSTLREYVDGDLETRRQVLTDLEAEPLPDLSAAGDFTEPVAVLAAEWFASPFDLCEAWIHLVTRSGQPDLGPIAPIATANPGLPDEAGTWDRIWFKGGSEPGVLGMSWHLTVPDGRAFVVAGSVVNETEAFDQTEASLLMGTIRDLLAAEVSE